MSQTQDNRILREVEAGPQVETEVEDKGAIAGTEELIKDGDRQAGTVGGVPALEIVK